MPVAGALSVRHRAAELLAVTDAEPGAGAVAAVPRIETLVASILAAGDIVEPNRLRSTKAVIGQLKL